MHSGFFLHAVGDRQRGSENSFQEGQGMKKVTDKNGRVNSSVLSWKRDTTPAGWNSTKVGRPTASSITKKKTEPSHKTAGKDTGCC